MIFSAPNAAPCDLLRSRLEHAGILSVMLNEHGSAIAGAGWPVPSGAALAWAWPEVWVHERDAAAAMVLAHGTQGAGCGGTPRAGGADAHDPSVGAAGRTSAEQEEGCQESVEVREIQCPYCRRMLSFSPGAAGTVHECPWCCEALVVVVDSGIPPWLPPIPLETARLILRRLTCRDADKLDSWVHPEQGWSPGDLERLGARDILEWIRTGPNNHLTQPGGCLHLAAELREGSVLIGLATLRYVDRVRHRLQCGVLVHKEYRGRGLGTELLAGIAQVAIRGFRAHRLVTLIDGRDPIALRVASKTGFHLMRGSVQNRWCQAEGLPTVEYAMLWRDLALHPVASS